MYALKRIIVVFPKKAFDQNQKIRTWEIISLEKMKDLTDTSERLKPKELPIAEILLELIGFEYEMKAIIDHELDVL